MWNVFGKDMKKNCFKRWADYVFELSKNKFCKQNQMFCFGALESN
jgi:hypothetical protein